MPPSQEPSTRDRLIAAARDAFLEQGYQTTSVAAIARRAGEEDLALVQPELAGRDLGAGEVQALEPLAQDLEAHQRGVDEGHRRATSAVVSAARAGAPGGAKGIR